VINLSLLKVKLTTAKADFGDSCKSDSQHYIQTEIFPIEASEDGLSAKMTIPAGKLPIINDQKEFYFCLSTPERPDFVHQGHITNAQIEVYELLLPIWLMIIFIAVLLSLSGPLLRPQSRSYGFGPD
jgi:hypothetical protein